ncbi:MAG: coproporphyrinogen III oxidase [Actinomycetales bacterium]|nr:MAG: coproporphyrinogen III oxidase [Actinomycetales bacterium]
MPPNLPDGDPAPPSGELPASALATLGDRAFGIYLHVPYCALRCGYCDFNTYALPESVATGPGAPERYATAVARELDVAARVLGSAAPPVDTIFVGGGTPTILAPETLTGLLRGIPDRFDLRPDAEVTVEANPDTMTPALADILAAAGCTRVSMGMQSADPRVLAVLERTHEPSHVAAAVRALRGAGLAVSVDLIYGTPGESTTDWMRTVRAALDLEPDHVSAYALVVEDGTRLAGRVRRGELAAPDDDDAATKYEMADDLFAAAGYTWYEVSNWARGPEHVCRHNLGYWSDGDWWGLGPGAHSHVGEVRWWNVKHPSVYADRLSARLSPAAGRETLTPEQRYAERMLLGARVAAGIPLAELSATGRAAVAGLVADGMIDGPSAITGRRVVLTRRGRLLADAVVRRLT